MPGALPDQVLPQKLTCGWIKTLWLPVVQELGEAHLLPSQRSRTTCASSSEVLFLLGTLVFATSLQLDRRGAWNMMGPCLFAFAVMATMWVYLCGHRRHCYPTSWQRWAFCLLPGISMAVVAIAIYTSMTTSDNYYYTHSIWHMLLAGSATFLLPPRDAHTKPWACSQELPCHYQICRNHQEELYRGGVTGSWQLSG
ncbi:Post-GPI attachment to proteins factor 6 [Manis javanica]|nr:Post-GPI attachment to proteins factor 6 [Manis javanica]